jgi:hypothetical protein
VKVTRVGESGVKEGRVKTLMVTLAVAAAAVGSGCEDRQTLCPPYPGVGLVVTGVNDQTSEPICDAVVTPVTIRLVALR